MTKSEKPERDLPLGLEPGEVADVPPQVATDETAWAREAFEKYVRKDNPELAAVLDSIARGTTE